ncbi:adenylate/guanylate cyclase domain-containing protein [Leisingera daeponensis]|uniref:Adenylate/guanylate cyclase domain-containing protein n=1 Tax=Leisingera daeponensis TaxID=405746 RepID=A0ABS7NH60_9RHOB|nr:adenylate/guanylate cyclase domain-containing protein [Leisingera daeponensis]MBY6140532.1 adenylate/guanylate cyclase domain-containing protein [Leisingera daeponensis]
MERRLAAVLAADMVGYSRLMDVDEQGTLARLRTHRIELIDPAITKNRGSIIKTTGDGMLVEFPSVCDAVACAAEVQDRMRRRNADVAPDKRIQFRVGVNLGDIIFDDGDIYGSGVNVAARLEQFAGTGDVCVSAAVYGQVRRMGGLQFEDLGEHILKNISEPVRVYRLLLDEDVPAAPPEEAGAPAPVVKPSLAVLPFANMSGDPEQEFFADGLTEDILTELSRRHELFVISRNSSFVYKGQAVNIREVAEKLGARYIVEGSVRKAGNRLRVTVQLIDSCNDSHIWAEKYDRTLDDIFEIQDEVTSAIVATLPGRIEAAQQDEVSRKKPSSLAAYECVLAAKVLHHRSTREDNAEAMKLIDRAVELDPEFAHAHAWRGCIRGQAWGYGWCDDVEAMLELAMASIQKAAEMDDNDADVHRLMAALAIIQNNLSQAQYHQERALALNPNYDLVVVQMGELLTWQGRPEEGAEWIRKAMRLNPHFPVRFWSHLGKAHFTARLYEEALSDFLRLPSMDAVQAGLAAACHSFLGNAQQAQDCVEQVRVMQPDATAEKLLSGLHYGREEDAAHFCEGLRTAGLE